MQLVFLVALIGVALSRFKVLILIPADAVVAALICCVGFANSSSPLSVTLSFLISAGALQLGYLAGMCAPS